MKRPNPELVPANRQFIITQHGAIYMRGAFEEMRSEFSKLVEFCRERKLPCQAALYELVDECVFGSPGGGGGRSPLP